MKNGKKPTRAQKARIGKANLNPDNWLVVSERPYKTMILLHKHTNNIRVIPSTVGI